MSAVAAGRGRIAAVSLCFVLLAGAGAWAVSRDAAPVPGGVRGATAAAVATAAEPWQVARVFDHSGVHGAPVLAATVRVPPGWQAQLSRDAGDCMPGQIPCVQWSARDAEGTSGVDLLPFESDLLVHDDAVDGGMRPQRVEEYLRELARQRHGDAEVVAYASAPGLAANPPFALLSSPRREAGRLTLRYRRSGREMREVLAAVVGEPERLAGIADGVPLPWFARAYAAYAPAGGPDLARAERIVASWRMDDAWLRAQDALWRQQALMITCRQMSLESQERCLEGMRRPPAEPEDGS